MPSTPVTSQRSRPRPAIDRLRVVSESGARRLLLGGLPVQTGHRISQVLELSTLLLDGGDEAIQLRLVTGLATIQSRIEIGKLGVRLKIGVLALLARGRREGALALFRA
jgi:hypothetical protein